MFLIRTVKAKIHICGTCVTFFLFSGGLSCGQYFQTCHSLMEDKNFVDIFAELMVLLPDIDKQEVSYYVRDKGISKSC